MKLEGFLLFGKEAIASRPRRGRPRCWSIGVAELALDLPDGLVILVGDVDGRFEGGGVECDAVKPRGENVDRVWSRSVAVSVGEERYMLVTGPARSSMSSMSSMSSRWGVSVAGVSTDVSTFRVDFVECLVCIIGNCGVGRRNKVLKWFVS